MGGLLLSRAANLMDLRQLPDPAAQQRAVRAAAVHAGGGPDAHFGIMGVVNLAHGSFYMLGAYLAWSLSSMTGSFTLAVIGGAVLSVLFGLALERLLFRHFYQRDHLDQVLLTFGLIYIFEEVRSILWGDDVHGVKIPDLLSASIPLTDNLSYPVVSAVHVGGVVALAIGLYLLISKTRLGMKIRAGAFNRT
jgi:branched-chain amino acid transport system permease protein